MKTAGRKLRSFSAIQTKVRVNVMMEIGHSFWIECAHLLQDPLGVERLHGHSYQVTVWAETNPDEPTPLGVVSGFASLVRGKIDHYYLNDIIPEPTMEKIAMWVYENIQGPRPTRITVARPSIGATLEFYPDATAAAFWRAKNDYTQGEIRHMKKGLAQAWRRVELCNQRLKENGLREVWTDLTSEYGLANKT
jgi:6-pyruvoyltetrahydropterin/6-carboxytetrahydropterin synthase